MNKIVNQYLITNYLKILINTILIFLSLGIILNLFEEIEFFKDLNESFKLPFILSLAYVPTLIIELLPFIVFLASMFFFLALRSNKDLLLVKISGYSNLKITLILAFFTLLFGLFILILVNPLTSTLVRYYETEKAKYAKDVGHLISINKNGVWIKEINDEGYKIINAELLQENVLKKISIYIFNTNNKVVKRIESESAIISDNPWEMKNVLVFDFINNTNNNFKTYKLETDEVLGKINSLYRNLSTLSFIDLVKNYSQLKSIGYEDKKLIEQIHKFASLPFFLFFMVFLASIFTIGSLKTRQNYYYVILSILVSVVIFYFKDLSIALGQTGKISLILSIWMPVLLVGLFCSIGVIQINEK